MIKAINGIVSKETAIYRITTLWAFSECGLGGLMHAFKFSFTGIFVGGLSVLFITLIALNSRNLKQDIFKALTIVLLIKLAVSPHSPIAAYFAVSLQAVLGFLIFRLFSTNLASILILTVVTFLASAIQKIIILTIIYGNSLWHAIDQYIFWVAKKLDYNTFNSETLVYLYILIYAVSGVIVGFLIRKITTNVDKVNLEDMPKNIQPSVLKTTKGKKSNLFFFAVLLIFIIIALYLSNNSNSPFSDGLYIVARSIIVITIWYFVLSPLLFSLLRKTLTNKETQLSIQIDKITNFFPLLKSIFIISWNQTSHYKGLNRIEKFVSKSIAYSINYNEIE